MLKSLLQCVWKGFEIVLRHSVIFVRLLHINSPGSFHPTSDVALSQMGQICLSTCVEKDALWSKLKYQSDTFYGLFLFITSTCMYFFKKMLMFVLLQLKLFFYEKSVLEEVFKGKIVSNRVKIWQFFIL